MIKTINNIELISGFLDFKDPDIYYTILVTKRRKDDPSMERGDEFLGMYYIDSEKYALRIFEKIKKLCDTKLARAYISLHPKSKELTTKECALAFTKRIIDNQYKNPWDVVDKVSGSKEVTVSRKIYKRERWVLDIDTKNEVEIEEIKNYIKEISTIHSEIPTKNGIHFWVDAFNISNVKDEIKRLVQKDCNTILYMSYGGEYNN